MSLSPLANLTALRAFGTGQQVTAHNIANVSTAGFKPQVVHYQSGPNADYGVRAVVDGNAGNVGTGAAPPAAVEQTGPTQPSGTDLAREMVNLMLNQRSFEANTVPIRTSDDMLGYLVDLKV